MRNSLRWKIFGNIVVAVLIIFIVNRIIAQSLTPVAVRSSIKEYIGRSVEACKDLAEKRALFLGCALQNSRDVIYGGLAKHYVLCLPEESFSTEQPAICNQIRGMSSTISVESLSTSVEISKRKVNEEIWFVANSKSDPNGLLIATREYDIDNYVNSLWNLRAQVVTFTAPFIVVCLLILTWYCSSLIMAPIRQIEEALKKLSSKNLDQPMDIIPVYKEFDNFIAVFELLRIRLNESFIQARRFAGDASHELKTPLTILRGNAERVIARLPTGSEEQIRMRSVADEVERLIEITEKLLLLSSADANIIQHDIKEVSISDVIGQLVLDSQIFQSKLNITSELQPKIFWNCDQNLINQLFYNLYTNAVKYNVEDGWIKMRLVKTDHGFEFAMSNPTANPPDDLAKKAFDRFYRGDSSRTRDIDGLGLGLSLAQEIARVHGSKLSMEVSIENIVTLRLSYPANVL
jgi:signal transduction histidine kinase